LTERFFAQTYEFCCACYKKRERWTIEEMAQPTTLTITYTGGSGSPQTVPIPTSSAGSVAGVAQPVVPQYFTAVVNRIFANGGVWVVIAGVNTFIPWGQITSITAQ
jgi:hypothetical protein